jgi:hypothetical protein
MYKCKIHYWISWAEAMTCKELNIEADSYASALRSLFWTTDLEDEDIEKIEIKRIE